MISHMIPKKSDILSPKQHQQYQLISNTDIITIRCAFNI